MEIQAGRDRRMRMVERHAGRARVVVVVVVVVTMGDEGGDIHR